MIKGLRANLNGKGNEENYRGEAKLLKLHNTITTFSCKNFQVFSNASNELKIVKHTYH
jgi:hypothetical protein